MSDEKLWKIEYPKCDKPLSEEELIALKEQFEIFMKKYGNKEEIGQGRSK